MKKLTLTSVLFSVILISGCNSSPYFNDNPALSEKEGQQYRAVARIQVLRDSGSPDSDTQIEKAISELEDLVIEVISEETGKASIERLRLSWLISIQVVADDPNKAADLANLISERYVSSSEYQNARIVDKASPPKASVNQEK